MATYLARITVRDDLELDEILGMADALGAVGTPAVAAGSVVFEVPGEAPESVVAFAAASQHAGEILDGYTYDVDVTETFA